MVMQTMTDNSQEVKLLSPPYVSYLTFKNLLEWLETEGVPLRFDRSFWSKKYSGSLGPQLMSGIRFLGLLIEEKPTPLLENLVNAKGDERKASLRDIYRQAYKVVDFDALQRATPGMLNEWFASYSIDGSTLRKAESFFVNALKDADYPLSNSLKKLARNKAGGRSSPASTGSRNSRTKKEPLAQLPNEQNPDPPVREMTTDSADAQASLMLWGLFKRLPKPGSVFATHDRESWLAAASTLFNLEYQVESQDSRLNVG